MKEKQTRVGITPDYWRQLDVFNPEAFNTSVHVIDAGATGSWVALVLAKMGVKNLIVWDQSVVEEADIKMGIYGREEIGLPKVEALKKIIARDCGIEISARCEKVDGSQELSGVVYLCSGTMPARKEVWGKALKYKIPVQLVVDVRLSSEASELGAIYVVKPLNALDIRGYEKSFMSASEDVSRSPFETIPMLLSLAGHRPVGSSDKGNQFIVTIGRENTKAKRISLLESDAPTAKEGDGTVANALVVAKMTLAADEKVFVNGDLAELSDELSGDEVILIKKVAVEDLLVGKVILGMVGTKLALADANTGGCNCVKCFLQVRMPAFKPATHTVIHNGVVLAVTEINEVKVTAGDSILVGESVTAMKIA